MRVSPRVSVVVPAYNAELTIKRTIVSILQQRLQEFEIIIVDDGSTREIGATLQGYLQRDERIRLIRQTNLGLAAARNRGIAAAVAPLVAPLDADDLWHPEFLSALVEALECCPEAPFAFAYSFRMDAEDRLLSMMKHPTPPRHDFAGLLSLNSVACGSAAVFRRAALQQAGGYDEDLRRRGVEGAEDWKLILNLASKAAPALVPRHLVGYRLTQTSMSQDKPRRQLRSVLSVLDDARAAYPTTPSRWFADARTMMTAWLLPAFLAKRDFGFAARQAVRAYLGNPLWFRNPLLWRIHRARLEQYVGELVGWVLRRRIPQPHLADAVFEGARPFSYMVAPPKPDKV